MEIYSLTPKGYSIANSTNGASDPTHPDYAKWQIIYKLKFLHNADKNKLITMCGLNQASFALAMASLKRHGYVIDNSQTQSGINEYI